LKDFFLITVTAKITHTIPVYITVETSKPFLAAGKMASARVSVVGT